MSDHGQQFISRRNMLQSTSCGFGYLAFAGLAAEAAAADQKFKNPMAARAPHFKAKAKRVIFLFMQGGPSHVDTFDYKPELQRNDGKTGGVSYKGKPTKGKLLGSPWKFQKHGKSGLQISELFPELSKHADDLCLINGMHTDSPAHPQATIMVHTGATNFVRPSVGSWVFYGLGSENQNLPGFITINPLSRLAENHGSAFLPAFYQGTKITGDGRNNLPNIANRFLSKQTQRKQLDFLQAMNHDLLENSKTNREIEGVIQSYELAYRMQHTVPEVMDISGESKKTLEMYGIGSGSDSSVNAKGKGKGKQQTSDRFGRQCLMARRFAEAGVRYIELTHNGWDQHNSLQKKLSSNAQVTDKPIAGLIADLKQRGMLDETLIVWGGEFGRTPSAQNGRDGRAHNNRGYTMWMAGGGIKGGIRHGETDPLGFQSVNDKVHIHDLHATMLHLLGLNHQKLTFRYSGRDFRLTNVYGNVVKNIIA